DPNCWQNNAYLDGDFDLSFPGNNPRYVQFPTSAQMGTNDAYLAQGQDGNSFLRLRGRSNCTTLPYASSEAWLPMNYSGTQINVSFEARTSAPGNSEVDLLVRGQRFTGASLTSTFALKSFSQNVTRDEFGLIIARQT